MNEQRRVGVRELMARRTALGGEAFDVARTSVSHLHVEDRIVHRHALGQLEVEGLLGVDGLQQVGEARRIGADLVDDVAHLDDVAGALGDLHFDAVAHRA